MRRERVLPPFTVQDLVRLARVSEPAVSPDGKHVAYVLRTHRYGRQQGPHRHLAARDRQAQRRRPCGSPISPRTRPRPNGARDGRFLYYVSNRSGSTQVWRLAPGTDPTGEPTAGHESAARCRVASASRRRAIASSSVWRCYRDCPTLACTKQRLDATAHSKQHGVLYDRIFVRHWDTWSDGRRSQLFALALDVARALRAATPVNLTAGTRRRRAGKALRRPRRFRAESRRTARWRSRSAPCRSGSLGRRTSTSTSCRPRAARRAILTADNPAWDGQPAFSPNGTTLAYACHGSAGISSPTAFTWCCSISRAARSVRSRRTGTARSRALPGRATAKSCSRPPITSASVPLWAIDAATGRASAITGDGHVEAFSVGPQRVFYAHSNLAHPADLYAVGLDGGKPTQLTHLNDAELAARALGEYRAIQLSRRERRQCLRLRRQAAELQTRPEISRGALDPRRTRGKLRRTNGIGAGTLRPSRAPDMAW